MSDPFVLSLEGCQSRQKRLLEWMRHQRLDAVVVCRRATVQWLTGCHYPPLFEPLAAIQADGNVLLVAPERKMPQQAAVQEVVPYQAQWHSTLRNDQRAATAEVFRNAWPQCARWQRVGVEYSTAGPHLTGLFPQAQLADAEPQLYYLRRRKEPDELALLRQAIGATGAMYQRARQIIRPGLCELEMFNQLQAVAVDYLGEPLTGTGNDYASGQRGGPPRPRTAEAGELYILDLGPAYRGYFADNARTLSVDRKPTQEQLAAWECICQVFQMVEETVRPGLRCRELFDRVQQHLDQYRPGAFNHHLGHGIGLFPHEAPHLNPHWEDVFEPGDVFTVEPGLYGPELRAGIRLENDYLVTPQGVELLTPFPLELA